MKISILGNGSVGRNLGSLLVANGFAVHLGARSHDGKDYVDGIVLGTFAEACEASEIIFSALPWSVEGRRVSIEILKTLPVAGKLVIDLTNPLNPDWSPLSLGTETSAGEETARALPECRVVKAFNTIFADMMHPSVLQAMPTRPAGLYCGDDVDAKAQVAEILSSAGFDPVDAGDLAGARYLEQVAHLNIRLAMSQPEGTRAAFAYLR